VQGVITAVLLVGFVANVWPLAALAALVLVAQLALGPRLFEPEQVTTASATTVAELGLLVLAMAAFALGRAAWGWAITVAAAVLAGLAAIAGIWLPRPGGYVRKPQ
jgi:hypothetical protein